MYILSKSQLAQVTYSYKVNVLVKRGQKTYSIWFFICTKTPLLYCTPSVPKWLFDFYFMCVFKEGDFSYVLGRNMDQIAIKIWKNRIAIAIATQVSQSHRNRKVRNRNRKYKNRKINLEIAIAKIQRCDAIGTPAYHTHLSVVK